MTATTTPTLNERFERLNKSGVSYCCLFGFEQLPNTPATPFTILTPNPREVALMLNAMCIGEPEYRVPTSGLEVDARIYETGKNVLPSRFENVILNNACRHNVTDVGGSYSYVNIPRFDDQRHIALWWAVRYNAPIEGYIKRLIEEQLEARVGQPMRPKYPVLWTNDARQESLTKAL